MLREAPQLHERSSGEPLVLIPAAPGAATAENDDATTTNTLDDVFGSAPPSPTLHPAGESPSTVHSAAATHPSDIPRLRSIHVTNGYREGIAVSKDESIQAGFDEGYNLGGEIGLKAGQILGILEGLLLALLRGSRNSEGQNDVVGSVRKELELARRELQIENLLGQSFFDAEGIWSYDVPGEEIEGRISISFRQVAKQHPVLSRWTAATRDLLGGLGLRVSVETLEDASQ